MEDQNSQQVEKISTSSYLSRQSSARWTPTTEQIKLLKELYYINGVRSPTADQIQAICARLRRYGKIEGKNVFYWFQNHKARERQKKRLTPTPTTTTTTTTTPHFQNTNNIINNTTNNNNNGGINNCWKQDDIAKYPCITNNNGISCASSSAGMVSGGGQLVGGFQYGGVTMENKFKDCSISGGVFNGTGNVNNTTNWNPLLGGGGGGGDTYFSSYAGYSNFQDRISTIDDEQDHYAEQPQIEIETLPLFPMHNKDDHNNNNNNNNDHFNLASTAFYSGGYRWSNGGGNATASLELSLNSYGYGCYSHNY